MKVLFVLPGLHRYDRGAELAFISIGSELGKTGDEVTLIGSGRVRGERPYRFLPTTSIARENFESFPSLPLLRNECVFEELTFIPDLLRNYKPSDYDVTLTCSYPFTNWILRRPVLRGSRPPHVFVTQNGDWPAYATNAEYRFFGCEGLVCTNPDFYNRNKNRWRSHLIPNGVDLNHFQPGEPQRQEFGLPEDRLVVLMVSALVPNKCVEAGIDAVNRISGAHLVVAGDGPLRQKIDFAAARLLPGRFTRLSVTPDRMPELYQSADVFLHLAKEEAFGNVFLEAMACGVPVVAQDSPRVRWIVGDDEFLVDSNDSAAIVRGIQSARHAPNSRRQERVNRAAAFSLTKTTETYRSFLESVVTSSPGKRERPER